MINFMYALVISILLFLIIEIGCRTRYYLKRKGLSSAKRLKLIFLGKWLIRDEDSNPLYIKEIADNLEIGTDEMISIFSKASGKSPDVIKKTFLERTAVLEKYNYKPMVGFTPEKNQDLIHLKINSLGFRNKEISREKPYGTKRAVLLGGSVAYGRSATSDEYTIACSLEKYLNENDSENNWEVINCAAPDIISYQEILILLKDGLSLNPDVVVSFSGINDAAHFINTGLVNSPPSMKKVTTAYDAFFGKFWHRVILFLSTFLISVYYLDILINRRTKDESGDLSPYMYTIW